MYKNNYLPANTHSILAIIAYGLLLINITACTSNPQPNGADYYQQCDTMNQANTEPKKQPNNSPEEQQGIPPEEHFRKEATILLNALQQNDFPTARQYATKRGLGTLLYINDEQITHYQIENCTVNKKNALAKVRINHKTTPIRFEFTKTDTHWKLQGINRQDAEKQ